MALDPVLSISNPASPIAVSAQQWRRLDIASTMAHDAHDLAARAGVASGMACTVSGLTVTLSPGSAIVTPTAGANGSYRVAAGSNTAVTLAARDASFARNDLIVLRVYDASVDTSGRWEAALEVVTGTASASPSDPTIPAGALLLYRAIVPASGSVTMVDLRRYTAALGGVIPCLSTQRPTGSAMRPGQSIYETNTGRELRWDGSGWVPQDPNPGDPSQILISALIATNTNSSGDASFDIPFPAGISGVAVPAAVVFSDAMSNMDLGIVSARWNVAASTPTRVAFRVRQASGAILPSYPVRFSVIIAIRVSVS